LGLACVLEFLKCFKIAAMNIAPISNFDSFWRGALNPYLMVSLFIYMMTTILWIWLLRLVSLKQAYPLIALAFVIVPILARLFLGEKLELKSIIGGIIIFIGVYVSVR
jgi:undecaprenyl phosphate-alpha-L-ara4N flippase subunit ArnE